MTVKNGGKKLERKKHFTDIYQQADDDLEAVFCDSFLHAKCHEITKKQADHLRELMRARKKKIPLVYL